MKDSDRLARIDQKLTDFMALYKEHRTEDIQYRTVLEKRVDIVDKWRRKVEQPIKWAGTAILLSATGAFAYIGEKAVKWFVHGPH